MDATGQLPGGGPFVLFDMDGTLVDGQTIHHLCRRFGVLEAAREHWASEDRGPTSVGRSVKQRVARLFEGTPVREIEAAVRDLAFHGAAHDVVEALRAEGATLGLVTASYHPAAERARRALMLDLAIGVELVVEDGRVTGELASSGYDGPCGEWVCKRSVLEAHAERFEATHTVAVGDGLNDVCMLEAADLGIAVEGAPQRVRESADVTAGLGEVPRLVRERVSGQPRQRR